MFISEHTGHIPQSERDQGRSEKKERSQKERKAGDGDVKKSQERREQSQKQWIVEVQVKLQIAIAAAERSVNNESLRKEVSQTAEKQSETGCVTLVGDTWIGQSFRPFVSCLEFTLFSLVCTMYEFESAEEGCFKTNAFLRTSLKLGKFTDLEFGP